MLQQNEPQDFVLATGEMHTVREFTELAFREIDIPLEWRGEGEQEVGVNNATGKVLVAVDPRYYRPTEVELLIGDPSKAKRILGWEPKIKFSELVKLMAKADLEKVTKRGY